MCEKTEKEKHSISCKVCVLPLPPSPPHRPYHDWLSSFLTENTESATEQNGPESK